jgi:response regulator RpfG family c-di-GMP phosphodiesterase
VDLKEGRWTAWNATADRVVQLYRTIDWKIVLVLSTVPFLRELIMGLFFAHHGNPFATSKDVIHTLLETAFMIVTGAWISWFRFTRHMALQKQKLLKRMVDERTDEIRLTRQTSIEALATLSEYHDHTTGDHIRRIGGYVRALARWLERRCDCSAYFDHWPEFVEDLSLAAILHDIGKNAVPESILTKPGKLSAEEFELVKTHTSLAGEIFQKANQFFVDRYGKDSYLALARDIANSHHERWDGSGYPEGLRGEAIPFSARIVALADTYDALISKRPYKDPWSHEEAVIEIVNGRGTSFDPVVVDAFIANQTVFRNIRDRLANTENSVR